MADERFGQAFWPGCAGFISCSATNHEGLSPGTATLVVPYQPLDSFDRAGDLTITDGVGEPIVWRNCAIVHVAETEVASGRGLALTIADRRRLWRLGAIDGWYNQPDPEPNLEELVQPGAGEFFAFGGPFIPGTARSPLFLMKECLKAMGETVYQIRPFPDVPGPTIDWKAENPAAALQQICSAVGFRITLQHKTNGVLVTPVAESVFQFGELPIVRDHPGIAAPDPPSQALVVGSPALVADYLPLVAVGLDGDGEIKRINDLSYKPNDGWEPYPPGLHYLAVKKGLCESIEQAKNLAKRWVWMAYRIAPDRLGFVAPVVQRSAVKGLPDLKTRRQVELRDRVYTPRKDAIGHWITQPPKVIGTYYDGSGWAKLNSDPLAYYDQPFSIDTQRGLVWFERPFFLAKNRQGGEATVAGGGFTARETDDAFLYTSYSVRDQRLGQLIAKTWGKLFGAPGVQSTLPEILHHEEMTAVYVVNRLKRQQFALANNGVESNEADLERQARYYLDASRNKYATQPSLTRTFAGIYPVDPDGGVRQVTWSVGGGSPATTTVSIAAEHATWLPSYPERRQAQLVDGLLRRGG